MCIFSWEHNINPPPVATSENDVPVTFWWDAVDGSNPAPHGMQKTPVNNGMICQTQQVSRISSINSMDWFCGG